MPFEKYILEVDAFLFVYVVHSSQLPLLVAMNDFNNISFMVIRFTIKSLISIETNSFIDKETLLRYIALHKSIMFIYI